MPANTWGSDQPSSGTCRRAATSGMRANAESTAPSTSRLTGDCDRVAGSDARPSTNASTTKGTRARKVPRQPATLMITPPRIGPTARPMPLAAAHDASARVRSGPANISPVSASDGAARPAAPTPIIVREAMSVSGAELRLAANVPMPNIMRPTRKTRRWP